MFINKNTKISFLTKPSLWFLMFSNIAVIFFAVTENWNLLIVIWIYLFQSIIIGLFNFIRILQLKEFSTKGFMINGRPIPPTRGVKIFAAFFFLFHFGIFHLVYLIFILVGTFTEEYGSAPDSVELKYILLTILLFFINHLFSYFYNKSTDVKKQKIGALMFYPYARIIPMHLTIIFAFLINSSLIFFLVLKTIADIIMHIIEHTALRKEEAIAQKMAQP